MNGTCIFLGTGDQILIDYDPTGEVRAIKTPRGSSLILRQEPLISFRRFSIHEAQSDSAITQDFNANGQLIASSYPSGLRRTILTYTSDHRLQAIYFGPNSIDFAYNDNGLPVQVKKSSDQLTATTDFSYAGSVLVDAVGLKYSGMLELEPVTMRFE